MDLEDVCGIPTRLFSLSNGGEEDNSMVPLVVIIPGSPGMCSFYRPFARKLFDLGQGSIEVAVVSHAGHSPGHYKEIPHSETRVGVEIKQSFTNWYTVQDQIAHKLAFIRERAPNRPLVLVGHSIGSWMILEMLKQLPPSRVSKIFLLFPTVEKLAETPNALSYLSLCWGYLRIPFTGLVWTASHLIPSGVKSFVLNCHFYTTPSEHKPVIVEGVMNIDEKSTYNILKMAAQEMNEVVHPPVDVIDSNIDKIVFYYGVHDNWNVQSCYEDMAARYPGKEVHLCPPHFPHAFVETVSDEIAEMVFSKL